MDPLFIDTGAYTTGGRLTLVEFSEQRYRQAERQPDGQPECCTIAADWPELLQPPTV